MVGDARFIAKRIDQLAIFPLRAGDLHTGTWRYDFTSPRSRAAVERASEDLIIHVTEPPRAGRPPGYTLGDVGRFNLTASVEPRRIDQGSEVSVRLRLTGTGNLPQSLRVPERTGLEWLDPEKKESIEPQAGVIGGWRTFGYVVRVKEAARSISARSPCPTGIPPRAGTRWPGRCWARSRSTRPSRRSIPPRGNRWISRRPIPSSPSPAPAPRWGPTRRPRRRGSAAGPLWGIIAAPPLLVGMVSLSAGAARRARARRATAKDSPAALAQKALAEARRAEAAGDRKALAAALERAVHLAIEGHRAQVARVLADDLPGELADRGIEAELGDAITGALAACEAVRFDPTDATTPDLAARIRAVVADLGRHKAP